MVREVKIELMLMVRGQDLSDKKLTEYIENSNIHIPYKDGFEVIEIDIKNIEVQK